MEFLTSLGLKATAPQRKSGVKELPAWLRKHGLHHLYDRTILSSTPRSSPKCWPNIWTNGVFNLFWEVICSVLIGNALALKQKGVFGQLFVDGHTDFMTAGFSSTKAVAGMDLSIVTGHGHPRLTDIQYHDLSTIREKGMKRMAMGFLEMVKKKGLDGFFVHLEVDLLDHRIMPAVDSPQEGGLSYGNFPNCSWDPCQAPRPWGWKSPFWFPVWIGKDGPPKPLCGNWSSCW